MTADKKFCLWPRCNSRHGVSTKRKVVWALVHLVSLAILLLVLIAAIVNRRIIPFYGWIEDTPVENLGLHIVAIVSRQDMHWRRRLTRIPLLEEEARARDNLIEQIKRIRPTHGIILQGEGALFGRLEKLDTGNFRLEFEDADGRQVREVPPEQVVWHKSIAYPPVELLPEDIRFLLDFPNCNYYYMPPYLFVSDAPYSYVHQAYDILGELAGEFREIFRVLMTRESSRKLVYACFFRKEETYLRHAIDKEDVCLERSVGFYSRNADCLFVYDRLGSFARTRMDRQIERMAAAVADVGDDRLRDVLKQFVEDQKELTHRMLRDQVSRTLRHEGAHQLAFSLGVHSGQGIEHLWIEEGLAQYCETTPIGQLIPEKLQVLRDAHKQRRLIPWAELINTPTPRGYSDYHTRADIAYAQAWLLFYCLMQPRSRARFLDYLDTVRNLSRPPTRPRTELLEEALQRPFLEVALALNAVLDEGYLEPTSEVLRNFPDRLAPSPDLAP